MTELFFSKANVTSVIYTKFTVVAAAANGDDSGGDAD